MPASGTRNIPPLAIIVAVLLVAVVAITVALKSGKFRNDHASTVQGASAPAAPAPSQVPDAQQHATGPEANEQHNSANEVGGTEHTGANTAGPG